MKRIKGWLCVFALSALAQVNAQDAEAPAEKNWADAFPPGSIQTAEDAQRALQAAHAESARADRAFTEGKARCAKSFFVTSCENKIHSENKKSRVLVRRVELEAHDRQRALDAQARDERRAAEQQNTKPAPKSGEKQSSEKQISERRAAQSNEQRLKRQADVPQHQADYDKKVQAQQQRAAEREASAPERAAEAEAFARKQAEAQRYAEQKAKQKEENQKRRDERKKEREEEAARREQAVPVP